MTNCLGNVPLGSTCQSTPSSEVAARLVGLLVAATSPAGPVASTICTAPVVRARSRATATCGVHDRASGEVHDTTGGAYGLMQEVLVQSVLTRSVRATRPEGTSAMPPDGCAEDAGGRTWVPQGFARAIPTNVATSSATTTLALGPLGSAGTSLPGSGDGSITADQRRRWNTVAGACLRVNRARPGATAPSGRSRA